MAIPTSQPVTTPLPAYLYQQYNNDPNLLSFFTAYNTTSQNYLNQINNLNLPIYTGLSGNLLTFVALGLYGFNRPALPVGVLTIVGGDYNTEDYNTIDYNAAIVSGSSTLLAVTDDIFKRCITWNFYKGDGYQMDTMWLKRRVLRFLQGTNGTDITNIGDLQYISVAYTSGNFVNIRVTPGYNDTMAQILQSAVIHEVLQLPFQYTFTVTYS